MQNRHGQRLATVDANRRRRGVSPLPNGVSHDVPLARPTRRPSSTHSDNTTETSALPLLSSSTSTRRRSSSTISLPSSDHVLPPNELAELQLIVESVDDHLNNLVHALDRLPVPETAARNDVWVARATHEILRNLAGRFALLLWFWHLGEI